MANVVCTPVSAFWCPACGDCTCARTKSGECALDTPTCPLHGLASKHADTIELEDCRERVLELAAGCDVELTANDHEVVSRFAQYLFDRSRRKAAS